jgi:formylglycine-generating enzyme required for sulfatase activity
MSDNLSFLWIPAGTFSMGSNNGDSDERPVHEVCVDGFYLAATPTTQALWEEVMGFNPSHFKGANRPVENVSWNDTQTFIAKLNKATDSEHRLPTAAEWEYAARAGCNGEYSLDKDGNEVTENNIGDYAWYRNNSNGETHDVATKKPNKFGLYDMHGNVLQWCEDRAPVPKYEYRMLLGSSWLHDRGYCRADFRNRSTPDYRVNFIGFRLALSR